MRKYKILRTDTADIGLRKIILSIAENFGAETALEKLALIEKQISRLECNPLLGAVPRYMVLKRQGYRVLILEKDLVFYKINEAEQVVIIYAIVDQRQDYMSILQGL